MASTTTATPTLADSLFQRSLTDLIRTLRSTPSLEPALLSSSLSEIRREILSTDHDTKSVALQKLTFLSSLHHVDMSWAAFHAVELLPTHKRVAYLAASLSFHSSTDVLLLLTNQLRKDLGSNSDPVAGLALEFVSVAATPDLARDLTPEVYNLLASSRVPVRKKATAAVLRIFSRCPDSVRVAFKRLVENSECTDQRIVSAAIGVFCELSAADPRAYLPLAPEFYRILVDCKNNWVLIKVLKIFTRLVPLEPRLAKRVVEPVCELMRRSLAKSLVLECIRTVLLSLDEYEHAVRIAVEKIKEYLCSDDDPNLRYLGLHALSMLKPVYSWAVEENKEVIVKSFNDSDPNIQREALHLLMGLVTESNVVEISKLLVNQALKSDPLFCNEVLGAILSTCSRDFYSLIVDFDWYVTLLGVMSRNPHCAKGEEIERQLVDIALRVKDCRLELVHTARGLLIDPALLGNPFLYRILSAAAWISGEYVEFSRNPFELVEALIQPRTNLLPTLERAVYIQAVFKVVIFCYSSYLAQIEAGRITCQSELTFEGPVPGNTNSAKGESSANCIVDEISNIESHDIACHKEESLLGLPERKDPITYESVKQMLNLVIAALSPLRECDEVEVQERARNVLGLIHILEETQVSVIEKDTTNNASRLTEIIRFMQDAISEDLGPVPANAQQNIPVPADLELLENLADIAGIIGEDEAEAPSIPSFLPHSHHHGEMDEEAELLTESTSLLAEHKKRHGVYYLPSEKQETESNKYPRANDPHSNVAGDVTGELTRKLVDPKKSKPLKPRPVVIKLDEENSVPSSSSKQVKETKDDSVSGAVCNVLLGNEDEAMLNKNRSLDKSSQRREKDIYLNKESTSLSKENLENPDQGSSKRRQRGRGKHKHLNSQENEDKKEEKSHRDSHRSRHHRDGHKHRQRGDSSLEVVPRDSVIQDFLL